MRGEKPPATSASASSAAAAAASGVTRTSAAGATCRACAAVMPVRTPSSTASAATQIPVTGAGGDGERRLDSVCAAPRGEVGDPQDAIHGASLG
jgi:hypothetical protein